MFELFVVINCYVYNGINENLNFEFTLLSLLRFYITYREDVSQFELKSVSYYSQIIRNSDLEELQELGSGTYGTVYHGKWRGTDVAIKRIKQSCFAGSSSEQERLVRPDLTSESQFCI